MGGLVLPESVFLWQIGGLNFAPGIWAALRRHHPEIQLWISGWWRPHRCPDCGPLSRPTIVPRIFEPPSGHLSGLAVLVIGVGVDFSSCRCCRVVPCRCYACTRERLRTRRPASGLRGLQPHRHHGTFRSHDRAFYERRPPRPSHVGRSTQSGQAVVILALAISGRVSRSPEAQQACRCRRSGRNSGAGKLWRLVGAGDMRIPEGRFYLSGRAARSPEAQEACRS